MNRSLTIIVWLYAAILAGDLQVQAQGRTSFDVAVGAVGTESFVFGTELWAVSQIELLPNRGFSLETIAMRSEADRLRRLNDGDVEFALVRDDVSTSSARHLRAVIALWPNGGAQADVEPTQLLVHRNVSDAVVYQITRTIFEHAEKLLGTRATIGIGSPDDAIVGFSLPIHPGAYRYYVERGLGSDHEAALTSQWPDVLQSHNGHRYAKLENDELLQLKAACREGLELEVLGYLDAHDVAEICQAYGVAVTKVDSLNLSHGRGGPKLSMAGGENAIQQSDTRRRDRGPKARGLRPTM